MKPIKPTPTLSERTYETLLEAICNGELAPGDRLNQDEIAARLNVSRQPVNSAVSLLKANRFAVDRGRRGVMVAEMSPELFRSIFEFRQAIEPFAVRLAGNRLPEDAREKVQLILAQGRMAAQEGRVAALIKADVDFHELIYAWSGNSVIQKSMELNWPHIRRSMAEVLRGTEGALPVWDEHEQIAEALLSGRAKDAERLMEAHIARAYGKLVPSTLNAPAD